MEIIQLWVFPFESCFEIHQDRIFLVQDSFGAGGVATQHLIAKRVIALADIDFVLSVPQEKASLLRVRVH